MAVADITVNLKSRNNSGEIAYRLLPKTLANNVTESNDKQFVSSAQKERWDAKQDKINGIDGEYIDNMFREDLDI